jgi:hypothetical protein
VGTFVFALAFLEAETLECSLNGAEIVALGEDVDL